MNGLSIFLYLIDILGDLEQLAVMVWIVGLASIAFGYIFAYGTAEGDEDMVSGLKKINKWLIPMIVIAIITVMVIPSQKTMYMIGGSQVAEMTIETPEFDKVRLLLNDKLDELLEKKEDQ